MYIGHKQTYKNLSTTPTPNTNPSTGFYIWNGRNVAPIVCKDIYSRCNWTLFEPSQDVYDFSLIRREAAKVNGIGKFGFAFRCVVEGINRAYPAYIDGKTKAWYSPTKKCWVPDWNDAYFLERHDALVAALGKEFNHDPRIAYVEIRSFGNWGEWHLFGFENPPVPLQKITDATIRKMIDAFVKHFPNKQIIMMSDNPIGLRYALSQSNLANPIGWRRDSWCNKQMDALQRSAAWDLAKDRWMTAPVTVEGYGNTGMDYKLALPHVSNYHISSIGNGNFGNVGNSTWTDYPINVRNTLLASAANAGYKYVLNNVSFNFTTASNVTPSSNVPTITAPTITASASWSNVGNAPTYNKWNVMYNVCSNNKVISSTVSKLDLRKLLPGSITIKDTLGPLAPGLAPGMYDVELRITDSNNYYVNPLSIAGNFNRQANGSYYVGKLIC
jgi:hypothetical protein